MNRKNVILLVFFILILFSGVNRYVMLLTRYGCYLIHLFIPALLTNNTGKLYVKEVYW